jgi:hypothetical protein
MNQIIHRFADSRHIAIKTGEYRYQYSGTTFLEKFKNGLPIDQVMRCELYQLDCIGSRTALAATDAGNRQNSYYSDPDDFDENTYYKEPLKAGKTRDRKERKVKNTATTKEKHAAKKKYVKKKKNRIRQKGYSDKLFYRENENRNTESEEEEGWCVEDEEYEYCYYVSPHICHPFVSNVKRQKIHNKRNKRPKETP